MKIGLGLDATLNLSWRDQETLSREAATLGYDSLWTPESNGQDSFSTCTAWWRGSRKVIDPGLITGIAVSPVMYRSPMAFAKSAGELAEMSGGRFILGIGSGSAYRADARRAFGLKPVPVLTLMREYVESIRALLSGDAVDYEGMAITLKNARLGMRPPRTPIYLGALGPNMLQLGGELADGVCLNWCSPAQVQINRQRIAEGATRAGRNPADIEVVEYIRVAVDDNHDRARDALARVVLGYALGNTMPSERDRRFGYRAHFECMGFADELMELDVMRAQGAKLDHLVKKTPDALLSAVGCYGNAQEVVAQFKVLAAGLDRAIVRVVATQSDLDGVRVGMLACRPELVA